MAQPQENTKTSRNDPTIEAQTLGRAKLTPGVPRLLRVGFLRVAIFGCFDRSSGHPMARENPNEYHGEGQDEEDVDEPARDVEGRKADHPEHEEYRGETPQQIQHGFILLIGNRRNVRARCSRERLRGDSLDG
jgi:hypothetical protein